MSLFSFNRKNAANKLRVAQIPVHQIQENPFHPRRVEDPQQLEKLVQSIERQGLLVPLVVNEIDKTRFEIISGMLRLKACRLLGLSMVPAVITKLSGLEQVEVMLAENMQRRGLTQLEILDAVSRASKEYERIELETLAAHVGWNEKELKAALPLMELSEVLREAVLRGLVSEETATQLSHLPKEEQLSALKSMVRDQMSPARKEQAEPQRQEARPVVPVEPEVKEAPAVPAYKDVLPYGDHPAPVLRQKVQQILSQVSKDRLVDPRAVADLVGSVLLEADSPERNLKARMALDEGDAFLDVHVLEVMRIALKVAHALGWPRERMVTLGEAALFYDLGMRDLPETLLQKTEPLTDDDWKDIQSHPNEGGELLDVLNHISPETARVAREHHERFDGSGYPRGLKSHDLSSFSRLMAVVDYFVALMGHRPYRPAFSPRKALEKVVLETEKGRFDPEITKVLTQVVCLFEVGTKVKLESGEIASVVETRQDDIFNPVIRIEQDERGNPVPPGAQVDLRESKAFAIKEILPSGE